MVGVLLVYFVIYFSSSESAVANLVSRPPNPWIVLEGQNITFVWSYTLDSTIAFSKFSNVTGGGSGVQIAQHSGGSTTVLGNFPARFTVSISVTRAEITLYGVRISDQGDYEYDLTSGNGGTFRSDVQLIVNVPTTLNTATSNHTEFEGSAFQLVCQFSGSPVPNVTWVKLFLNGSVSAILHRVPTWKITGNNRANAGTYRCTGYNGAGTPVTHTLELNVLYLAKIIKHHNSSAQVGGCTALVCLSEGNPSPVITWTRDKTENIIGVGSILCLCSAQFHDSVEVCRECSCNWTISIAVVGTLVTIIIALIIYVIWLHRREARAKERQYQNPVDDKGKNNTAIEMQNREPSLTVLPRQQAAESYSRSQHMALDEERRSAESLEHPNTNNSQISEYAPLHPSTRSWEIPKENVIIEKVIGKGAFGQVAKGTAVGLQGKPPKTHVAVKMLKEPLLVLIEYVPYGDLLGYLRKSRGLNDTYYKDPDVKPQTSLTSQQLMKFAWQIADGMNYLSLRSIIHRDLAARNVLVGEGERCKVTDFGMARDVQRENIYERKTTGRLPVKWTAYEALLYGKYTTKSDVWSYGVLLYEIFTIGGSPYPRTDGRIIATLLQQGYRMPKPNHVNDELYDIMTMCWQKDPNARPTFGDLRNKLKQMENQHKRLINMNMYDTHLYANVEDLGV